MTLLTEHALRRIRKTAQRFLTDHLEVWRMTWTEDLNETTLVSGYDTGTMIYEGPGRVRPTSQQQQVVGESVAVFRNAGINLPHDAPSIHRNDVIKVATSQNPTLMGRWFQVVEERWATQEGLRRVEGLAIAPSRLWLGSEVDQ